MTEKDEKFESSDKSIVSIKYGNIKNELKDF